MSNTNLIKTDSDALELAEAINKADYEHYLWKQAMKDYQSRKTTEALKQAKSNGASIGRPAFPDQEHGKEILEMLKIGRANRIKWRELVDAVEEKYNHRYAKSSLFGYHKKYNMQDS